MIKGLSGRVARNRVLRRIGSWGPVFKLTFNLMIHSKVSSYYSTVLAFKGNGGRGDNRNYGDRVPAIFYRQDGYLHITCAVNGKKSYPVNVRIDLGRWYRIDIEQANLHGKVSSRYTDTRVLLFILVEVFVTGAPTCSGNCWKPLKSCPDSRLIL